jgi:ankyrin repeat protein
VDFLLRIVDEAPVKLDWKDKDGFTALHCACQLGHMRLVREFVQRGAAINALNKQRDTPLFVAKRYGHDAIAEFLVIKGAVIHCQNDDFLWEPGQPQVS